MNRKEMLQQAAVAVLGVIAGASVAASAARAHFIPAAPAITPLTCAPSDVEAAMLIRMAYNRSAAAHAQADAERQWRENAAMGRDWTGRGVDPHPPTWEVSEHPAVPMTREQIDAVIALWGDQPLKVQGRR